MTNRKSMLSASIIAALMFTGAAFAHDHPAPQGQDFTPSTQDDSQNSNQSGHQGQDAKDLEGVVVVGIRASMQKSLQTKRNANAIVEAVTADDLGKFPNTNAAESLSLTPGVTVDRQFGQGQRVSIDGTNPSLNLSLLDGHPVAQTTWRYAQTPDRGFNFLMIAPEMLGRIEVFKNQKANLPAGSIGGTIVMHSRKPLDMDANTFSGTVGYNYNDQASTGKPSVSALYSWKTQDETFGFNVALQHYEEQLDRQGLETFGYSHVSDFADAGNTYVQSAIADGTLRPDDYVPQEVNAAWFQQHLKRDSALVNLQFRPNEHVDGNLSLMYIKEDFTNYNQSIYNFLTQTGDSMQDVDRFDRGQNGVITGGHTSPTAGSNLGIIYDNQLRPSKITTKGADFKLGYHDDAWAIDGRAGFSESKNPSVGQKFIEPVYSGAYSWQIHKGFQPDDPAHYHDPANWGSKTAWFGNYNIFHAKQKDKYGELNFQVYFDSVINTIEAGVRYMDAKTNYGANAFGGVASGTLEDVGTIGNADILGSFPGIYPGIATHPNVGAGNVNNWVMNSPDLDYPALAPQGDNAPFTSQQTWAYDQKTTAAYIQADYATDVLRGNFGVRWVRTKNTGYGYVIPNGTDVTFDNLESFWTKDSGTVNKLLPSFTIIYDNGGDVVLRGGMAKVMAWAPYNMMANQVFLNETTFQGSSGNPGLKPYTAYNSNVSVEWYFAPQSAFAVSAFYKNVLNYITQKTVTRSEYNNIHSSDPDNFADNYVGFHGCRADGYCDFAVQMPTGGGGAHVKGLTFAYQTAFDNGFGLAANYTYAAGKTNQGTAMPFLSRHSLSLSPYFEKGPFSARLNVSSRSEYLGVGYVAGAVPPTTDAFTTVSASMGWRFNEHLSLSLNGDNLTNTKYYQYQYGDGGQELPLSKYTTGRRFSLQLHAKF